jgi:formamidopyrimidine-DNA glycosylase
LPEIVEIELYRRLAERAVGRPIASSSLPDSWWVKRTSPEAIAAVLDGDKFTAARRIGKLLLLDLAAGETLGLRFGMTGRLVVDDEVAIERLEYSPRVERPEWDRFEVRFVDGGGLRVSDPRRLGGVELEPDTSTLGPDALSISAAELRAALDRSAAPLKARLMDQSRVAGLGNLLTDEILWRASLDPARPAGSLSAPDLRRLHRHLRGTLDDLSARGGSHTGRLQPHRERGGLCPKDGTALERRTIGGRTTYSCPAHQL